MVKMTEDLNYIPRLQQKYNEVIQKELLSNLNLNNIFVVGNLSITAFGGGKGPPKGFWLALGPHDPAIELDSGPLLSPVCCRAVRVSPFRERS